MLLTWLIVINFIPYPFVEPFMSLLIHRPWVRQGVSSLEEFFVDRFRECFIKDLQVLTHSVRMGTNALTYRIVWVVRVRIV